MENTKNWFGLAIPPGWFVSVIVPRKSLSFAMNSVCFLTPPIVTSGPNARLSSFAGMSFEAMPCAFSAATTSTSSAVFTAYGASPLSLLAWLTSCAPARSIWNTFLNAAVESSPRPLPSRSSTSSSCSLTATTSLMVGYFGFAAVPMLVSG